MKVVVGLGNPGPEYDDTRHNVGWWVLDRLAYDWELGSFRREGRAFLRDGTVDGTPVLLLKPAIYMNRSGQALTVLAGLQEFDLQDDLLVIVDDASLEVGRIRFRPGGGSGGHNGLRSVEQALGTEQYARLRVGVGRAPPDADLADWVLSPMPPEDEEEVVGLLPELSRAVETWVAEGVQAAMNRYNR